MAGSIGKAGGALSKKLLCIAEVLLGFGLVVWLFVPGLSAWALPVALLLGVRLLQGKDVERTRAANVKGYVDEAQVGRVLAEPLSTIAAPSLPAPMASGSGESAGMGSSARHGACRFCGWKTRWLT